MFSHTILKNLIFLSLRTLAKSRLSHMQYSPELTLIFLSLRTFENNISATIFSEISNIPHVQHPLWMA